MANSDKDILITPNTGQTSDPTIEFTGADNTPLTLRVLDDGTVSFEGTAGQLFSISDGLTGTIFSVNDISGIPSIEVLDDGTVKVAEYSGNVGIGKASPSTKLDVDGTVTATTFDGSLDWSNVANKPDPTITLGGDLSGSVTLTDLGNGTLTATVADNSHNHTSSNISDFTESVQDVVGGMVSTNTESGISVTYDDANGKLDFDVNDPTITLSGDVTGSGTITNLGNVTITATVVDDSHNHVISNVDGLQAALDDKAPLASPTLSGTPTAPTAASGTNTTQIATTAFVQAATAALVDAAPTTLNTLNELAAALGDDPNFATTVTNSIAGKQPLDADLTAIAGLTGTSGLLKKTAADTWTLDTTAYTTNTGTVTSVGVSVPTGLSVSGTPVSTSGTIAISLAAGYSIPTTTSQSNWDTAYTDRNKWDGGSTGLTPSTGRASLGATTIGSNIFTLTNPSAITFLRLNADNTVSALSAADFRTAIGAGTSSTVGTVTSVGITVPTGLSVSGSPVTSSGTLAVSLASGYEIPTTTALDAKAPLASPTFTGTVTAATLDLTTAVTATAASHYWVATGSDGVVRPKTLANVRTEIVTNAAVNSAAATTVGTITSGTWAATDVGLAHGGTNASLTAANGGVVYSTASAMAITSAGTAGQILTSNGASAPTWQNAPETGFAPFLLAGM